MHYNLLFNGCSYTCGGELEGMQKDYDYRDKHRFSHLISEQLGKTYVNISENGHSNDRITRETIEWFNAGNTCDLAIIQWSNIARREYISNFDRYLVKFLPTSITTLWKTEFKEAHRQTKEAHEHYYKYFYNVNIGFYDFYRNLYILEQFFKYHNINYLFLKLDEVIAIDDRTWQPLCEHNYYNITTIKDDIIPYYNKTYYTKDYRDLGYSFLIGKHPNELGHQKIAEYLIQKIS
jgi:hypothetical protein